MRAHAFDDLAPEYDASFTSTPLGSVLRALVWSRLDRVLAGARRVLEIGCGTGEDAIRLACRGARVLAIDASPAMLRVAAEKARVQGCSERIDFRCLPMEELDSIRTAEKFDGTLSNFGALNCTIELPSVIRSVAEQLEPGARLVWVLMGRYVPWEWGWYLLRAEPKKAWRRLRDSASWRGLTIAYPMPRDVKRMLQPFFRVDSLSPLGFALPPSYAAAWLNRRPQMLAALTHLEHMAQGCSPLASCADHYIVEATRLPVTVGEA